MDSIKENQNLMEVEEAPTPSEGPSTVNITTTAGPNNIGPAPSSVGPNAPPNAKLSSTSGAARRRRLKAKLRAADATTDAQNPRPRPTEAQPTEEARAEGLRPTGPTSKEGGKPEAEAEVPPAALSNSSDPQPGDNATQPAGAVGAVGPRPDCPAAQEGGAPAAGAGGSRKPAENNRPTFATVAKRQPAIVILGRDARLTADQLKQASRVIDGLLWKLTLKGTPLAINTHATRDSCLLIWPSDAESGRRLLELLPEQNWEANMAFHREDEPPQTKRHRIFVPAASVVTSSEELRNGLLAVNRDLPAAGLVVHDTILQPEGRGFTAILGLSDAWMRKYPDDTQIAIGLLKLRIRAFEADKRRQQGANSTEAAAEGATAPKAARYSGRGRNAQQGRVGKPDRAAEGGSDRHPARSTKRKGLLQRAAEAVQAAKLTHLRREAAGQSRRIAQPRAIGGATGGPSSVEQGPRGPRQNAQGRALAETVGTPQEVSSAAGGSGAPLAAQRPLAGQEPDPEELMDTGSPRSNLMTEEEEEGLLAQSPQKSVEQQ